MSVNLAALLYLVSGILFILALRGLSSPETARRGNLFGMAGMALAIVTTLLAVDLDALSLVLIFTSGMHLMMLGAIIHSYQTFPVGEPLPFGDAAEMMGRLLDQAFVLATQVAAPLLLVGTLFQVALGLLARLMPTIQVFFIAIPVQMLIGLSVMAITLSAAMLVWLDRVGQRLDMLLP